MTEQDAINLMMDYDVIWGDRHPRWLGRYWMVWHIYKESIVRMLWRRRRMGVQHSR